MTAATQHPNQVGWIVGFILIANVFGALPIPPSIVVIWTMSLFANALFIGGLIGAWFVCTQNRQSWQFPPALVMGVYMLASTFAFGSDSFPRSARGCIRGLHGSGDVRVARGGRLYGVHVQLLQRPIPTALINPSCVPASWSMKKQAPD